MVEQAFEEYAEQLGAEILPQLKFYPDFPKKGVNFLDIFSATGNPAIFKKLIDGMRKMVLEKYG